MEISEEEYRRLKRDSLMLSALKAGGVDNWEWYGEAWNDAIKLYIENNVATDEEIEEAKEN